MPDRMSYADIVKLYPNEHVLLGDYEVDEQSRVKSGVLLCHSQVQSELFAVAKESKGTNLAFRYTGKLSSDVIVIL